MKLVLAGVVVAVSFLVGCGASMSAAQTETYNPNVDRVRKQREFDDALLRAQASPADPALLATFVRIADDYLRFHRTYFDAVDSRRQALGLPLYESAVSVAPDCDVKRLALTLLPEERVLVRVAEEPVRACLLSVVGWVVDVHQRHNACEDGVHWAASLWPLASTEHEKASIFDAIDACSDAFTREAHFSLLPAAAIGAYAEVLARREAERQRAANADIQAQSAEQCESRCMTRYAENGVCNNSCYGDSRCLQSCAALGEECFASCR